MTTDRSIGGVTSRLRSPPTDRAPARTASSTQAPSGPGRSTIRFGWARMAGGMGLPSRSRCIARSLKARPDSTSARGCAGSSRAGPWTAGSNAVVASHGAQRERVERVGVRDGVARYGIGATAHASRFDERAGAVMQRPQRVRRTAGQEQRLAGGAQRQQQQERERRPGERVPPRLRQREGGNGDDERPYHRRVAQHEAADHHLRAARDERDRGDDDGQHADDQEAAAHRRPRQDRGQPAQADAFEAVRDAVEPGLEHRDRRRQRQAAGERERWQERIGVVQHLRGQPRDERERQDAPDHERPRQAVAVPHHTVDEQHRAGGDQPLATRLGQHPRDAEVVVVPRLQVNRIERGGEPHEDVLQEHRLDQLVAELQVLVDEPRRRGARRTRPRPTASRRGRRGAAWAAGRAAAAPG